MKHKIFSAKVDKKTINLRKDWRVAAACG